MVNHILNSSETSSFCINSEQFKKIAKVNNIYALITTPSIDIDSDPLCIYIFTLDHLSPVSVDTLIESVSHLKSSTSSCDYISANFLKQVLVLQMFTVDS